MDTTAIEQHLLWTTTPTATTGWGFQLDWKKAVESWTSPKDHARRMIDKFVALSRQKTSTEA